MDTKRTAMVAAALLVTALAVTGFAGAAPKDPNPKEVVVTNDATQPVPTAPQGTTQVEGSVVVANTASAPVPVDVQEDSSELTLFSGQIDMDGGQMASDQLVDIPAGKRFVVEYFTAAGFDWEPSVEEDVAQVRLTNLGPPGSPFVAVPVERNAEGRYAASEPVQWVMDGPFVVRIDLDRPASGSGQFKWSLAWTLTGRFVDA